MKRGISISARWPVATVMAVTLSYLVIGTALSATAGGINAYYLIGDSSNSGSGQTQFISSSAGDAWNFSATGSSATTIAATCPNGTACWGVLGKGNGIGVYGTAGNPSNEGGSIMGVQGAGSSTGTNGTSYGGYFSASNSASGGKAIGVYGSGLTSGVYATSSTNAVRAISTGAAGNGVYATGSGSSFYGVWGDVGGAGYGVVGSSAGGNGVYGSTSGSSSTTKVAGVYGYNGLSAVGSASATNSGVFGTCVSCIGVSGTSANYVGVRGVATGIGKGTVGGYFSAQNGIGVSARTATGSTALYAFQGDRSAGHLAGLFDGDVRINGNYYATGTKTAVVATDQGDRLMYAEEATQNYFSDQGTATLRRGRAVVTIDPLFAQTVDLSKPYMVIVTPLSFDTAGLGAGNLSASSFEVRELNSGRGNFTFSWRITALRKGYTDVRMAAAPPNVVSTTLPTGPSSSDTRLMDPLVAPPTQKAAPAALPPSAPAMK
jgi:hypothetical protein